MLASVYFRKNSLWNFFESGDTAYNHCIKIDRPNKNGNFDTKLPFIFYAENAYMQGFSEIRKVSLWFFVRYFPVKMLLFA